jgi:hypothetical protein
MAEMNRQRGIHATGNVDIIERIESLERKISQVVGMETELLGLKVRAQVSDEAFQRQAAFLKAERTHYADEMERQQQHLATMEASNQSIDLLETMRDSILSKLTNATPQEKRWVLGTLNTRVTVREEQLDISIGVPPHMQIEPDHTVHISQRVLAPSWDIASRDDSKSVWASKYPNSRPSSRAKIE